MFDKDEIELKTQVLLTDLVGVQDIGVVRETKAVEPGFNYVKLTDTLNTNLYSAGKEM